MPASTKVPPLVVTMDSIHAAADGLIAFAST
jgi:hypothetical protein